MPCCTHPAQYCVVLGDPPESDWAVLDDFRRIKGGAVVTMAPTHLGVQDWDKWWRTRAYKTDFPLFPVSLPEAPAPRVDETAS